MAIIESVRWARLPKLFASSALARVTIAFTQPDKGEIALQVRSAKRFVPAVAKRSGVSFERGDEVVVVSYRGGVAEVLSRDDFTQLHGNA